MPLPTLLVKGHLVANDPKKQDELDKYVPIEYIMKWFKMRKNLKGPTNRILVLKSQTASGKSTALPAYIYKNFHEKGAGIIASTQPRVITAINNAIEITKTPAYNFLKLGENLGWQTKTNKKVVRQGIIFMTIGVLSAHLKLLEDDDIIKKYHFIILDEIHELSTEMATALFYLKKLYFRNKHREDLPFMICLSATINVSKYLNYFELPQDNAIQVMGFAFPKTIHWLNQPADDYLKAIYNTIDQIHNKNLNDDPEKSDILIFLPSPKEMKDLEKLLASLIDKYIRNNIPPILVLKVDRSAVQTQSPDYVKTFKPANMLNIEIKGKKYTPLRKVIMSTSVAETGLTLDTLKYVIDSGYHRGTEFYSSLGTTALLNKPASKDRIEQRKGRAGRKFPGEFYPMYTEKTFNKLQDEQFSEVVINDSSSIVLASMLGDKHELHSIFDARKIDIIDRLAPDNIHYSVEKCYLLGFYSPISRTITELGKIATKFTQVQLENIRMILSGYFWNCNIFDLITIAAYLQMDASQFNIFSRTPPDWVKIYQKSNANFLVNTPTNKVIFKTRLLISDNFIDAIFLFNAISNIISQSSSNNFYYDVIKFSEEVNIKFETIINFLEIRDDIIENMLNIGMDLNQNVSSINDVEDDEFINSLVKIKHCIYEGYRMNLAIYDDSLGSYKIHGRRIETPPFFSEDEIKLAQSNKFGISHKMLPKYIIFDKLNIRYNRKTKMYDIKTSRISALDNFVNVDLNFLSF